MSDKKLITCPNVGCRMTFKHRMAKKRHLEKGCRGTPCEKPIKNDMVNLEIGWLCKICNTQLKHRNNISRHRRLCQRQKPVKPELSCTVCGKKFAYISKLAQHEICHSRSLHSCKNCGKVFKRGNYLENHYAKCIDGINDSITPSMVNLFSEHIFTPIGVSNESSEICFEVTDVSSKNIEQLHKEQELNDISFETKGDTSENLDQLHQQQEINDSFLECFNQHVNLDATINNDEIFLTPPRRKQNRQAKARQRKVFTINSMLESVEEKERLKIIERAREENSLQMNKFSEATLNYFRQLIRNARSSHLAKLEGAKLLKKIFGDQIECVEFQVWLADNLRLKNREDLVSFLNYASSDLDYLKRGREKLPIAVRQEVYNFWIANSVVSVHRSNNRHIVKIKQENIYTTAVDLQDPNVTFFESASCKKLQAHRRIALKAYSALFKTFNDISSDTISYGSFINLKPFYVSAPSAKEMEMCLCSKCLNPHSLYKAIKNLVDTDMPYSLSDYLCKSFKCHPDPERFYDMKCLLGKCENNCEVINITKDLDINNAEMKIVSYYVFESVVTKYFNKKGEEVSYTRTARVDKKEPVSSVVEELQKASLSYLQHHFFVVNDNIHWKKFLKDTSHYILWLDYSQNIAFKEKRQCQSAHFSRKQQTLHNTVLQSPYNGGNLYLYHLSDDTNHDSVMTFAIIEDIIEKHPEVIEDRFLVLRSDNCQEQYKSKYTFHRMKDIALRYDITVAWFYGEPGHGRGLVDAMSSFGCKRQLQHAILTEDKWFDNAQDMVSFLTQYFDDDNSKEHYLVDSAKLAAQRKLDQKEHVIRPCRKFHLIAVNNQGMFDKVLYFEDSDILSRLFISTNLTDVGLAIDDDDDDNMQHFVLNKSTVYELLEPGTYVGMRSPQNAIEPFFVVEVLSKGTAEEDISDENGHSIMTGEQYAEVTYLQKNNETRKKITYKRPKKPQHIYIYIAEIFVTNIALDQNLCMDINEYQAVLSAAL